MAQAPHWTDQQVINQLTTPYSWHGPQITYNFPVNTAHVTAIYGEKGGFTPLNDAQQWLATLAINLWDDLIAPQVVRVGDGQAANIEFAYTSTGIDYAHAYLPGGGTVWLSKDASLVNAQVGAYGFEVYLHEIGHSVGLDHMGSYDASNPQGGYVASSFQDSTVYSLMSYFGPSHRDKHGEVAWGDWHKDGRLYSPQTPMINDIMAIQAMYGVGDARAGDTVYGFGANAAGPTGWLYDFQQNHTPILAIYDAGGHDTIDLTGWAQDSRLDLRPGTFSDGNGMTNNISIARNTVIENGRTGNGNDFMMGNDADNILISFGGDDTIYSGAGNDILYGGAGNNALHGGEGFDTYATDSAFYQVIAHGAHGNYRLMDTYGGAIDTVTSLESFSFADRTVTQEDLTASIYRFYNPYTGAHFFTASGEEAQNVHANLAGFDFEGVAWARNLDPDGGLSVHRFYNHETGAHFYTASEEEMMNVRDTMHSFQYEGVAYEAFSSKETGTTELYRFFNPNSGAHFYTASEVEMESVRVNLAGTFQYEGVAYYVDMV